LCLEQRRAVPGRNGDGALAAAPPPPRHPPLDQAPAGGRMKPRSRRLLVILGGLASVGVASALVLNALDSNVAFFFTPTQVNAGEAPRERTFRVGGLVKQDSLKRNQMTV